MISAELFRNFLSIYREGSVSAAARSRHLTQSAVSQQLSTLEEMIGADLRTVVHAVEQGFGVSIVPDFIGVPAIAQKRVFEIWPIKNFIPTDQWILAFRDLDADRSSIAYLSKALGGH